MTLSPAEIGENYIPKEDISDVSEHKWYSSKALGEFVTGQRAVQVKKYCAKHDISISLQPATSEQQLRFLCTDIFSCIISFKYAVIQIDAVNLETIKCTVLHAKHSVVTNIQTPNTSSIAFSTCTKYAQMIIPRHNSTSLTIICERSKNNHTPITHSIRTVAMENSDPGLMIFYQTIEEGVHIAIIQDKETGAFGCIHPHCKKTFKTQEEWRKHYTCPVPLSGQFARANFSSGNISIIPKQSFRPYVGKQKIVKLSLLFRSLLDEVNGPKMRQSLHSKLADLAFKRSWYRVYICIVFSVYIRIQP